MKISTEPEDLHLAYAAGLLPEAPSLAVAAQASLRSEVRRALGDYEAIAGALLDESESARLSPGLRDSVMARLDEETDSQPPQPAAGDVRLPAPLQPYVGRRLEELPWRRVMPGLKDYVLPATTGGTARLMLVKGGVRIPAHTHRGLELTLVLKGAYADASGLYEPGDLQLADDSVDHMPVAEKGEACLCFVVTEAPVRLTGRFGRLLNRFVRY